MVVGETDIEMLRRVTPTKRVLDFGVMNGSLSTEEGFRAEIQKICGDEKLPLVFPHIPDYFKARNQGFVINLEAIDSELCMPTILYNIETYKDHPELRGPMEDLILGYEKERVRQGLTGKTVIGEGWSQFFLKRLHDVQHLPLSETELHEGDNENKKLMPPLSGEKIA